MSHSHLGAKFLLAQIETERSRRANRDKRPDWLNNLVEEAAGSLEPLAGVARVGYECVPGDGCWNVSLYLGTVEVVGGKSDGHTKRPAFRCDLSRLLESFARIDELEWTVWPQDDAASDVMQQATITVNGMVGSNRVRLEVRSAAPETIGPGLREFADGHVEPV